MREPMDGFASLKLWNGWEAYGTRSTRMPHVRLYTASSGKLDFCQRRRRQICIRPAQVTIEAIEPGRAGCKGAPSAKAKV
jgi:hypothetical protein